VGPKAGAENISPIVRSHMYDLRHALRVFIGSFCIKILPYIECPAVSLVRSKRVRCLHTLLRTKFNEAIIPAELNAGI
jgi:hypothetical protein